jgi:hypothetical protein
LELRVIERVPAIKIPKKEEIKFGFPKVPRIAPYGLFHLTGSEKTKT